MSKIKTSYQSDVVFQTTKCKNVIPNDNNDLDFVDYYSQGFRKAPTLYIGVTGDLAVVPFGNDIVDSVIFKNVVAGTFLPLQVRRVLSTGTTCSNIIQML